MSKMMVDPDYVLDVGSMYRRADLDDAVNSLRERAKRVSIRMKALRKQLVQEPGIDPAKLEEYQRLNDQLRGIQIWRANMNYHLNML